MMVETEIVKKILFLGTNIGSSEKEGPKCELVQNVGTKIVFSPFCFNNC